jgi:cytochrome c biogenesis protein CcdA
VLRLIALVISIAAADAVNPSTLVPALYIASGPRAFAQVLRFSLGVLGVELGVGLGVILGPGELILDLVPHPTPVVEDWLQVGAGSGLLLLGLLAWRFRARLTRRQSADGQSTTQRSSLLLGAGIVTVGMPTNVAYLGAITTIVGSGRDLGVQLLLLVIYDAIFILPLAGILAVLALMPQRAERLLGALRRTIQTRAVPALIAVLLIAGAFVLVLGLSGLTA